MLALCFIATGSVKAKVELSTFCAIALLCFLVGYFSSDSILHFNVFRFNLRAFLIASLLYPLG